MSAPCSLCGRTTPYGIIEEETCKQLSCPMLAMPSAGEIIGDATRGLYGKFFVERTDGKSAPGEKHHGCEYFVLDLHHDKHAIAALRAYLLSCRKEYPLLAHDLTDKLAAMEERLIPRHSDRSAS